MPREKVTLTLDPDRLQELRALVGARSLSAAVDSAVLAYLARLRHLSAVDEWLLELEREHGPVPPETLDWAARLVDDWASGGGAEGRRRQAG
ncbi:MAG TPA: CopG family transcriptional regulator [Thermoanaerobaculia bacterium]|nr:CopG family transcriptional regulator [Thermoanaerobaculia bacterium]